MAGSLTHVWSWEFEGEDFSAGTCSLLAKLSGKCSNVFFDKRSCLCLASFRSSQISSFSSHYIFTLEPGGHVKELRRIHTRERQSLLSRATLFTIPRDAGDWRLVASPDDSLNTCRLWNVDQAREVFTLPPHNTPVLDVKYFGDNKQHFLGSLSSRELRLYRLLDTTAG